MRQVFPTRDQGTFALSEGFSTGYTSIIEGGMENFGGGFFVYDNVVDKRKMHNCNT